MNNNKEMVRIYKDNTITVNELISGGDYLRNIAKSGIVDSIRIAELENSVISKGYNYTRIILNIKTSGNETTNNVEVFGIITDEELNDIKNNIKMEDE